MMTESAWSPPESGLVKLLETLAELDPNMVTSIRYEDEMPNFVGWYVYEGAELSDGCEDDSEEIMERIFNNYPDLREQWDDEAEDWKTDEDTGDYTEEAEQAMDEYRDVLYESISEWNDEGVGECLDYILQRKEEEA
jgi:AAA+ ATPase superfamily predicted ATPase